MPGLSMAAVASENGGRPVSRAYTSPLTSALHLRASKDFWMALDVLVTTDQIARDPVGRGFVEQVQRDAGTVQLDEAALYYDFPTYSDYETVAHKPDALIVSSRHGVVAIMLVDAMDPDQVPEFDGRRSGQVPGAVL